MNELTRQKRRVAVAALATASVLISIVGCSQQPSGGSSGAAKNLVVGSILQNHGGYQDVHGKMMEAYGKSIGVTVRTCNSEGKVSSEAKCVQDMIAAGVNAIIIQPVDITAAAAEVRSAQAAGISVITWANGPLEGVKVPYIDLAENEQAHQAGVTAAKWVKDNFNQSPMIVDLGIPKNSTCENRENGFIAGATEANPATVVAARPNGGGTRVVSQKAMSDVIQSGVKFNIVTGCNGDSTLGGLSALQAAGRGQAVDKKPISEYLFSIDGTADEITNLLNPKSPLMQVLALTPKTNAKVLLDAAVKLVDKKIDNSYTGHITDQFLTSDCAATKAFLADQYDATITCQ